MKKGSVIVLMFLIFFLPWIIYFVLFKIEKNRSESLDLHDLASSKVKQLKQLITQLNDFKNDFYLTNHEKSFFLTRRFELEDSYQSINQKNIDCVFIQNQKKQRPCYQQVIQNANNQIKIAQDFIHDFNYHQQISVCIQTLKNMHLASFLNTETLASENQTITVQWQQILDQINRTRLLQIPECDNLTDQTNH